MSMQFAELARSVAADGEVTAQEILALRRLGWGDGQITRAEAEAIFAVNRAIARPDGEWTDFFVEALAEFVLNGTEPRGMCDAAEAHWLIDALDADGRLETMAELELLVRVIERAHNVPDLLKHYALRQIEAAVLHGDGPTRCGGALAPGQITGAECRLLRRMIFAGGGDGPAAVSRFEAAMLFRLKDATLGSDNSPEWLDLFVDGVANCLTGFVLPNAQLGHARAKELEAFVADSNASVGRFLGAMAREVPQVANHFGKVFGRKTEGGPDYGALADAGEAVTEGEQSWLDSLVDADGQLDPLERALLARIAADAA